MIVRDHLPLRRVWPVVSRRLGWLFLYDLTIALLFTGGFTFVSLTSLPLGLMGAALSIFLAFRNNSAYDRWWEARSLWGALVNESRTFGRQAMTLVDTPHDLARGRGERGDHGEAAPLDAMDLIEWQIAYVH